MNAPSPTNDPTDPGRTKVDLARAKDRQHQESSEHTRAAQRLATQYVVTRILAEAATLKEATPAILQTIAQIAGWEVGVVWTVDRAAGVLHCVDTWHQDVGDFRAFEENTRSLTFAREVGLPGKVWAGREPVWIEDLHRYNHYCRSTTAHACGLRGAFVFPALFGGEVIGVIEFYSREMERPDEELLRTVGALGSQIGQFLERKRTEEELHKSRERFEVAVRGSGDGIWDWDLETNQVYFSPHWKGQLGYADDELPNAYQEWESRLHPEDRERTLAILRDYLEGRRPSYEPEFRLRHKDGSYRWILARAAALRCPDGTPYRLAGSHTDITGRKQVEEELRQARENLEKLVRQRTAELMQANAALRVDESRLQTLLALSEMAEAPEQQITDFALEEAVRLTGSKIGYLAFMNEDKTVLTLHSWSKAAMAQCAIQEKPIEDVVANTGLWSEAVRQRRPIITNDYAAPNPWNKGTPPGHVAIVRHMNVPVFDGSRIVAVAGVGNKEGPYDETDVRQLRLLMDGMWRLLRRRRAEEELKHHRDHLEELVAVRTAALQQANDRLTREVADRQGAEQALRESEEKHRLLYESSRDAIMTLAPPTWRFISGNPATVKMFGAKNEEEFTCHEPWELSPERQPDGRASAEKAIEMIETAMREGSHFFEWTHRRLNGEVFPATVLLSRIMLAGKAFLQATVRDITEQKRAEAALRASEERLRLFIEHAPVAIAMFDRDMHYLAASRRWLTDYLPGVASVRGQSHDEVFPESSDRWKAALRRGLAGEVVREEEDRWQRADGTVLWACYEVRPWNAADGAVGGVVIFTEDITERKRAEEELRQSEEKFRLMADTIPQLAWMARPDGYIFWYNRRCYEYTGATREQMVGWGWQSVHDPEVLPRVLERWRDALASGEPVGLEFPLRGADGQFHPFLTRVNPLRDEAGRILYWFGTATDITERKQIEDELRLAKEAAEAASRAKSDFLAAMSHEIRTPMNGIMGMTDLALATDLTGQQREYLELVKKSADALLAVINEILDFSKIEAGKLELDHTPFSLREGLGDMLTVLAIRAHQKGLELACHIAPDVPDALIGDPGRLRQVLVNLAGNAIKFTEQGEVVVDVAAVGRHEGAAALRFAVRDTGTGIPAGKLSSLFQPFVQLDGSLTRKYEGTGLGLTISSRLVEAMGGRITVESEVGKGSTFTFTVSLELQHGPGEPSVPAEPAQVRGLRVLVVDDNATNRRILEEMLAHWGLRPTAVDGGREALAALERAHQAGQPFRLVLLDARMPEMDGFTLAEAIRQHPESNEALILMVSSAGPADSTTRCRAAGVAELLTKPVKQADLWQGILRVLGTAAPAGPPAAARPAAPPGRPLRILLAEDNPVNQKLAVSLLEKQGHAVTVASNGREALAALYPPDSPPDEGGSRRFDVVLMDVQMPELDGLRTTKAIRERERVAGGHLPVIAMTAYALKGDRERCLEAGMDSYVSKPIRLTELVQAMQAVVPAPAADDVASRGPLDMTAALAGVMGDWQLLAKLAELFLAECPRWMTEMRAAVAGGDPPRLQLSAHTLKGGVATFTARAAYEAALRLEKMGRAGDLSAAPEALAALAQEIEHLRPALTALAGEGDPRARRAAAGPPSRG
jgi:PAS domain S-box-containing protein